MSRTEVEIDLIEYRQDVEECLVAAVHEFNNEENIDCLVHVRDNRLKITCEFDESQFLNKYVAQVEILINILNRLTRKIDDSYAKLDAAVREHARYLVDVLSELLHIDKSVARREIVMGSVKVNSKLVTDPSAKVINEPGLPSYIGYKNDIYPFYPRG